MERWTVFVKRRLLSTEMTIIKRKKIEILEIKNVILEMNNIVNVFKSRLLDRVEGRISDLENSQWAVHKFCIRDRKFS